MNKNLYVGNVSFKVTDEDLKTNFSEAGEVVSASIIKDKFTGQSKGFGFVEMKTEEGATEAIKKFNGGMLDGKAITVNEARPKKEFGAGGGGNRGGGGGYKGGGGNRGGGGGNRVAVPVHDERLAALAVVPGLAVKNLAIHELGPEDLEQVAVGGLALQDARSLAADIGPVIPGNLHPGAVDVDDARAGGGVQGHIGDHDPVMQVFQHDQPVKFQFHSDYSVSLPWGRPACRQS